MQPNVHRLKLKGISVTAIVFKEKLLDLNQVSTKVLKCVQISKKILDFECTTNNTLYEPNVG